MNNTASKKSLNVNIVKNKESEIVISKRDETEYLLRSTANRKHLLQVISDVEENRNIIVPEQKQFQ